MLIRQHGARQQGTGVEFLYWVGGNVLELRVVMAVQLCDGTKAIKLYISNIELRIYKFCLDKVVIKT